MTATVIMMLGQVGKVSSRSPPGGPGGELGLPELGGLVFLVVLVLGLACWVIGSENRAAWVSRGPCSPGEAPCGGARDRRPVWLLLGFLGR